MRALLLLAVLAAGPGWGACRQALVFGLDVSGSVDAGEYRLQADGLAAALEDGAVRAALLGAPGFDVEVAAFDWAGPGTARMIVPWTALSGPAALAGVTARLRAARRSEGDPSTALGEAMEFGAALLAERPGCLLRTLDITGDGQANTGRRPRQIIAAGTLDGVVVNALVVGADDRAAQDRRQGEIAELTAYFRAEVIHGPGAFVEAALGYADYERAMVRKLLRELQGLAIGALGDPAAAMRRR